MRVMYSSRRRKLYIPTLLPADQASDGFAKQRKPRKRKKLVEEETETIPNTKNLSSLILPLADQASGRFI